MFLTKWSSTPLFFSLWLITSAGYLTCSSVLHFFLHFLFSVNNYCYVFSISVGWAKLEIRRGWSDFCWGPGQARVSWILLTASRSPLTRTTRTATFGFLDHEYLETMYSMFRFGYFSFAGDHLHAIFSQEGECQRTRCWLVPHRAKTSPE